MNKQVKLNLFRFSFLFFFFFLSLTFISAETTDTYQQNQNIDLKVSCLNVNCSEQINITITYPNSSTAINNQETTLGSGYVNYTFSETLTLGEYTYFTNNGFEDSFLITPSGQSGTDNIVFYVLVIIIIIGINLIAFFGKNIPLTILTGMIAMFLGIYLISGGIIVYRDELTNYISYVIVGIGAITSFWAIFEQLDVL